MSEKFWRNSLNTGAVPVVYGPHPDDVKSVAPPNSYIHAVSKVSMRNIENTVMRHFKSTSHYGYF